MTPEVHYTAGVYRFKWPALGLEVVLDRVRENREGDFVADMRVKGPGRDGTGRILTAKLNLSSVQSRHATLKYLNDAYPGDLWPGFSWQTMLEYISAYIMDRLRRGEPAEELTESENIEVSWILKPLILENQIQVLYGPAGGLKSYIALYLSILVQNGLPFFGEPVQQGNVLYLDWETDRQEMQRRFTLLRRGIGREEVHGPLYKRCERRLFDDLHAIVRDIVEHEIRLIVIDSAGGACAGDIRSEESVLPFFSALREAMGGRAAALVLTHITKEERRGRTKQRLPIGSVYFENIPRQTWEVRVSHEGPETTATLFHRKCNMFAPHPPLSLTFSFFEDRVEVYRSENEEAKFENMSDTELIIEFLNEGPKSTSEVAFFLDKDNNQTRPLLHKLARQGKVVRTPDGLWALSPRRP